MGRTELPVRIHKYFLLEHEVQVSHMHNSDVEFELLTFYIKTRWNRLVYVSTKIRTNKILKVALMYWVLTNITRRRRASELASELVATHLDVLSRRVFVKVKKA